LKKRALPTFIWAFEYFGGLGKYGYGRKSRFCPLFLAICPLLYTKVGQKKLRNLVKNDRF
jgi:hypothetical protein